MSDVEQLRTAMADLSTRLTPQERLWFLRGLSTALEAVSGVVAELNQAVETLDKAGQ